MCAPCYAVALLQLTMQDLDPLSAGPLCCQHAISRMRAISRMPSLAAGVRLQRVAERDDERDGEAREADKEGGGRIRLEHVARDHVAVCARGRPARTLSGGG